jgi:chromate reductase, NAD(P)H dehydrogenase (quinone)
MTSKKSPKLLGLSGSLRSVSHNTALLRTLASRLSSSGKATLDLFALNEIPPYNGEADGETKPPAVVALKEAIAAADGLVLASPEYNFGMSGVLKNAIDWASRPAFDSVLKGKPFVVMTVSPAATGGVRAIAQMRETMFACLAEAVPTPDVVVAASYMKVKEGAFVDDENLAFAEGSIDALIARIHLGK